MYRYNVWQLIQFLRNTINEDIKDRDIDKQKSRSNSKMPTETISTPLTKLFGIKYPVILAGMNVAAGPELAAAVTNAGGLGVIGGIGYVLSRVFHRLF